MRNENGRIITKRRTLLNNRYEEIAMNKSNEQNKQKIINEQQNQVILPIQQQFQKQYINNDQQNNQANILQIQDISKSAIINPYYYHFYMPYPYFINNIHPSMKRAMSFQVLPVNNSFPIIQYSNSNFPIKINKTQQIQTPDYKEYNLSKRLNQSYQQRIDNSLEIKKRMMREDWLHQIEEKKKRLMVEKAKKLEEDKVEEAKWNLYLEKQKEKEKMYSIQKVSQAFPLQQQKDYNKTNSSVKAKSPYSTIEQTFKIINQKRDYINANQYHRIGNISKNYEAALQEQITNLRFDMNNEYIQMTNMYGRLKQDLIEADQLKSNTLQESVHLKKELIDSKIQNIIYDNKIEALINRNKYYIYKTKIPTHDYITNKKGNFKSTSAMMYDNEILPEHSSKNMSNLAQAGQYLVGETEFVPIQTPRLRSQERGHKDDAINDDANSNQYNKSGSLSELTEKKKNKMLKEDEEQKEFNELCGKLNEIAQINHQMNPLNKFNTMRKNLENDYKAIFTTKRNNKEIKKFNYMFDQHINENKLQNE